MCSAECFFDALEIVRPIVIRKKRAEDRDGRGSHLLIRRVRQRKIGEERLARQMGFTVDDDGCNRYVLTDFLANFSVVDDPVDLIRKVDGLL